MGQTAVVATNADRSLTMHETLQAALVVFLCASFGSHLPVIQEHLEEATYVGVTFIAFVIACAAMAVSVAFIDDRRLYAAAALLCGAAVLAYVATRVVAFPQIGDDVGNWFEKWGVISVISEVCAVAVAVALYRTTELSDQTPAGDR